MSVKLEAVHLEVLAKFGDKIKLRLANSNSAWEELGGEENYEILLDTLSNEFVKVNSENGLSLLMQYTNSKAVGIPEAYYEWKSFKGQFEIRSGDDDKNWSISCHGSDIEDCSEDLTDEDMWAITDVFTPEIIYKIAVEIISKAL